MPRTTLTGDDPAHELPNEEKDRLERQLRAEAEELRRAKKQRDKQRKLNRAINISRRPSRPAHGGDKAK